MVISETKFTLVPRKCEVTVCTELQAGRSPVRIPIVSLEFFIEFRPHYDPWVDTASNRNENQEFFRGSKGGRCVGLITLPSS